MKTLYYMFTHWSSEISVLPSRRPPPSPTLTLTLTPDPKLKPEPMIHVFECLIVFEECVANF